MRHYTVEIVLLSGETLFGQAQTTRIYQNAEFLQTKTENTLEEIRLDKIFTIKPLDHKAEFNCVVINNRT